MQAKAQCGNMRFLMVTGVSKFAKTSIFSAFNNPCDLTLDMRVADLLGYTHEEMEKYFHEHIQAFANEIGVSYDVMFAQLLAWYDGYQFSPQNLTKVVNPVSLGRALTHRAFDNYFAADPRPVWYVAINYNASTRTLDDPLCEPAKETRSPKN